MAIDDRELKQAALAGLRHERQRMDELIARLEREIGTGAATTPRRKRRLSAAGRTNIVAALKKRWAAVKTENAAAPTRRTKANPKPAGKKKEPVRKARRAPAKPVAKRPVRSTKVKPTPARKKATASKKAPAAIAVPTPVPVAVAERTEAQEATLS